MTYSTNMVSGQLSLVPIGDALAVKEELSLESAVVTLRKLDGRDKFTKMMQYGARFFYWWFASSDPALSERAFKLYRTTQRSRKAFRMLKILDEAVKLQKILRTAGKNQTASGSRGTGFLGYTEALMSLRCLVMGAFWTFDNLNYLTLTDTVNFGVARATKGFSRSWSVASALYILLGIDSLRKTERKRRGVLSEYAVAVSQRAVTPGGNGDGRSNGHGNGESDSLGNSSNGYGNGHVNGNGRGDGNRNGVPQQHQCEREEDEGEDGARREVRLREALTRANAEHFKSWLMVLKGAIDLTCAINISGMDLPKRIFGRKLNDGVVGAIGCVSALTVLYNSWPAKQQQQQQQQQRLPQPTLRQQRNVQQLQQQPPQRTQVPPQQQEQQEQSRRGKGFAA
ncbi:unnamed protein product [Pylaiella littoralis]